MSHPMLGLGDRQNADNEPGRRPGLASAQIPTSSSDPPSSTPFATVPGTNWPGSAPMATSPPLTSSRALNMPCWKDPGAGGADATANAERAWMPATNDVEM